MAPFADEVFDLANAGQPVPFGAAWLAALCYSFQIYFDFSGYCDMALGLARMFGIKLPINFNSPYQALNIVDFWRRWHITLSTFLRDYLYIPLGGSRKGKVRQYLALMLTMLLGGLWHGASWTFVFWGVLHGTYLCINHGWSGLSQYFNFHLYIPRFATRFLSRTSTLLAVLIAWVFFRADTFSSAAIMLKGMFGLTAYHNNKLWSSLLESNHELWYQCSVLAFVVLYLPNSIQFMKKYQPVLKLHKSSAKQDAIRAFFFRILVWRPSASWSISMGTLMSFGLFFLYRSNNLTEFIYFNF